MIYGLYAMRDSRTGFMSPVIEANDDAAIRNFAHTVRQSDGILSTFCQDFSLFRLGDFDADTGRVAPLVPIVQLADGAAVMRGVDSDVD